jgi:hypothetical protein
MSVVPSMPNLYGASPSSLVDTRYLSVFRNRSWGWEAFALHWANCVDHSEPMRHMCERYIEIDAKLKDEPRSRVVAFNRASGDGFQDRELFGLNRVYIGHRWFW